MVKGHPLQPLAFIGQAAVLLSLGVGAVGVAQGCQEHPIVAPVTHTPYDRYRDLHGQQTARVLRNAYGREEPNLRDRLRPLDQGD